MGSFWGMNDAGKEAAGFPREYGAWNFQQYKDMLDRARRYGDLGDFYNTGAADYWTERRNEGFASPGQISATGREISPWVQDYIANQTARRNSIRDLEAGRRPAGEVTGEMSGRLDEMGQNIGRNYSDIEGEINSNARRVMDRENGASEDVVNNIKNSSASMRGAVNDTFTGLRKDNSGTYDGIRKYGQSEFDKQLANLELLKPGSKLQGARVARSFAPQMADTLQRLRRAGIDPSSPQAASLLRSVETDRSRAMDDASAAGTESFIRQSNDVSNARVGFDTAAARGRLENEVGLATGQVDRSNDISGREASDFNREKRTNAANLNAVDMDRSGKTLTNTNNAFQQGQQLLGDRNELTNYGRTIGIQDVDRQNAITEGDGASELQSGRVYDNQFDRGTAWQGMNQATKDTAANNLGQIGRNYSQNMFQAGSQAGQFGRDATNAYHASYAMEAPKAGWGSRLLGGIASTALNFAVPGSGGVSQAIRGIGGAAIGGVSGGGSPAATMGGRQYGGGGQFGGGYQGNGTFSMLPPSAYKMPSFNDYSYDPAKTRTLPNGSLQVGRMGRTY